MQILVGLILIIVIFKCVRRCISSAAYATMGRLTGVCGSWTQSPPRSCRPPAGSRMCWTMGCHVRPPPAWPQSPSPFPQGCQPESGICVVLGQGNSKVGVPLWEHQLPPVKRTVSEDILFSYPQPDIFWSLYNSQWQGDTRRVESEIPVSSHLHGFCHAQNQFSSASSANMQG